jgi:glycyl-tRNA synthetase
VQNVIIDLRLMMPNCRAVAGTLRHERLARCSPRTPPVVETANQAYLRPETAQSIFINYENIRTTQRLKLPFGIAQIGKAFRNEITPGNFIFRSREFEQMELEYFVLPETSDEYHAEFVETCFNWFVKYGIKPDHLRKYVYPQSELSHYSRATTDIGCVPD